MKQHNYYEPLSLLLGEEQLSSPNNFVPDLHSNRAHALVDQEFLLELAKNMATDHFVNIRDGIATRVHATEDMLSLVNQLEKELTFLKSIQLVIEYKEPEYAMEACDTVSDLHLV